MIDEQKLLVSKIEDLIYAVSRGKAYSFTHFLSLEEQAVAENVAKRNKIGCYKFGGYDDCERSILSFYIVDKPEIYLFPYTVLTFKIKDGCEINHRDVLGALMSLGLKREVIGDILFSKAIFYIFTLDSIAD